MFSGNGDSGARGRVRVGLRVAQLLFAFAVVAPCTPPTEFADISALEAFVLATDDAGVKSSLSSALTMEGAGDMVSVAVKMGPAYATKVAGLLPDPGFRQGYSDLAKYLDMFGPCQKKDAPAAQGWWSNYPDPPSDKYCSEVSKLLFAALLWNQVHYCGRLASGEDAPRVPVPSGKRPPYRLDEPPVATHWLHADVLYAVTDAAVRFDFAKTLRARAGMTSGGVRGAMALAADELQRDKPNREMAAIAIAKLLVRRYEQTHIEHLERLRAAAASKPN